MLATIAITVLLVESVVSIGFIVYLQFAKPELVKRLEPIARVVFVVAASLSVFLIVAANIHVPLWVFRTMFLMFVVPLAIAAHKNDRKSDRQPKSRHQNSVQATSQNHNHQATPPDYQ